MMGANEGDTGPILMQPVGGMDKIISGFLNHVGEQVKYRAMVTSVQVTDKGVNVAYDQDGVRHSLEVDYCFNCIPTLMVGVDHIFRRITSLRCVRRGEAYKAAFQAKRRFWEIWTSMAAFPGRTPRAASCGIPRTGFTKPKASSLALMTMAAGCITP